jgi:hypothetical protein
VALLDNSIGSFAFVSLTGYRLPPRTRVREEDRDGVTGTEFTLAGRKGPPFTLVSQVDTETYEAACELYLQYLSAIDDDPLELIQAGVSSITEDNYLVKVIDVMPRRIIPIRGAVGYKLANSPNEGFCECDWILRAVPLS